MTSIVTLSGHTLVTPGNPEEEEKKEAARGVVKSSTNLAAYLLPGAGIEPAQHSVPRDFKSLASTNSAIPAQRL